MLFDAYGYYGNIIIIGVIELNSRKIKYNLLEMLGII